jgi:allophanate hydrolase
MIAGLAMIAGLKVLNPGLCTTVQDLGRAGYQALGVPVSGALDAVALRLGNALVGNPAAAAALEILVSGARLEVAADTVRVAVAGAGACLELDDGARVVPGWESATLTRGDIFTVRLRRQSACAYLAVEGGIAVPSVLGSAATCLRAAFGGFEGRSLRHDDVVPLASGRATERDEQRLPSPPPSGSDQRIRVVLGPQQDCFTAEALASLLDAEFRISKDADRMGMRLDGPPLRHRAGWDIVSDAIATGAIQVPGSGQPIVLLADHQTTGGYPKIATVISADLPVVGRRGPGDVIGFTAVSVEEAEELARAAERELIALIASFEPVPTHRNGSLDLGSLYGDNLISGVVTAVE